MVFADATTCYAVCPRRHKVWVNILAAPMREQLLVVPKLPTKHPIRLKWYAFIAPYHRLGLIHLVKGTTNYPAFFHVSTPDPPATGTGWCRVGLGSRAGGRRGRRR